MQTLTTCVNGFIESLKAFLPQEKTPEPGTGLEVFIDFCQYPLTMLLFIRLVVPTTVSQREIITAFRAFASQHLKDSELPDKPTLEFTNRERDGIALAWQAQLIIPLPKDTDLDAFGKRGITRRIHREYVIV